jgi:hypothetical protein
MELMPQAALGLNVFHPTQGADPDSDSEPAPNSSQDGDDVMGAATGDDSDSDDVSIITVSLVPCSLVM